MNQASNTHEASPFATLSELCYAVRRHLGLSLPLETSETIQEEKLTDEEP